MIVTIVHIKVKEEFIDDFIKITKYNHRNSILEKGNLRFDFLQKPDDPIHFILYEAYETPGDAAAHKETEHYLKWREKVSDWMAEPRQGIRYDVISPLERELW
jgi:autoinducer 2-degrading protein